MLLRIYLMNMSNCDLDVGLAAPRISSACRTRRRSAPVQVDDDASIHPRDALLRPWSVLGISDATAISIEYALRCACLVIYEPELYHPMCML